MFGFGFGIPGRARPGGGWSFDDLGSALLDVFDFEDASTLSLTGNLINSITGKKTGVVLSQNVTGSKPIYQPAGLNGRPVALFDGMDDALLTPSNHTYITGDTPLIMIALVRQDDGNGDSNTRVAFSLSGVVNSSRRIRKVVSGGIKRGSGLVGTGTGNNGILNNNVVFQGVHVIEGEFQATQIQLNMNGIAGGFQGIAPNTVAGQVCLGSTLVANQPWLGLINSALLVNPLHANWTATNKAALLAHLKYRGGIS